MKNSQFQTRQSRLSVLASSEKAKHKSLLGSIDPDNKTRARRVSLADNGAAQLSRLLPGVFQDIKWSGLISCLLYYTGEFIHNIIPYYAVKQMYM